jgi:hypothetical protein
MLVSEANKYLFLSNPKTGTTAIQDKLMKLDESAEMNRIQINGQRIKFPEHGNALLLEGKLGHRVEEYQIFTFIRDPYDKIVSAYFFYKNGEPLVHDNLLWYLKKGPKQFLKAFVSYVNVLFARILPFHIWSLLRKVKSNEKYLVDRNGKLLVNFVGQTEKLSQDLHEIIQKLGLANEVDEVVRLNSSSHNNTSSYYQRKWHRKRINRQYQRELRIYKLVQSKPVDFNYKGLNLNDALKDFD